MMPYCQEWVPLPWGVQFLLDRNDRLVWTPVVVQKGGLPVAWGQGDDEILIRVPVPINTTPKDVEFEVPTAASIIPLNIPTA